MSIVDTFNRPLTSLRVSVTDRCNLRCQYCMPEPDYVWLPRQDILTFEELSPLVDVFISLGADRVRLTGGEPLLRRDLDQFVRLLAAKTALRDIALTTNGVLLAEQAAALKAAGLHRVTVSLDTLRPDRFRELTRFDLLPAVLDGIQAARSLGFDPPKIDAVMIRGFNDDELFDLLEFARALEAEIRFIEYMDVGGATHWSVDRVLSRAEMLTRLEARYGPVTPVVEDSAAPAARFQLSDGLTFGVISSTTEPFCRTCDRSRLTADGLWYLCLYAVRGIDLRGPLRAGVSVEALRQVIARGWRERADRGAELRLEARDRQPYIPLKKLQEDPHLEMHTRGG